MTEPRTIITERLNRTVFTKRRYLISKATEKIHQTTPLVYQKLYQFVKTEPQNSLEHYLQSKNIGAEKNVLYLIKMIALITVAFLKYIA